MKRINSIVWGLALLAVSTVLILNAFGITNIEIFFDGWWTLFIIIPSFIGLFSSNNKIANTIVLLIGIFLLLTCQGFLDYDIMWKLAIPVIVAVCGIKLIFKGFTGNREIKIIDANNNQKNSVAAFSGQNICFDNQVFTGADLTAVFGGIECDLRNAVFEGDTVINTYNVFGGTDIFLPDTVNVKINSNSFFGGIDNKKRQGSNDNQYTVYINGTCIFGGVDIK